MEKRDSSVSAKVISSPLSPPFFIDGTSGDLNFWLKKSFQEEIRSLTYASLQLLREKTTDRNYSDVGLCLDFEAKLSVIQNVCFRSSPSFTAPYHQTEGGSSLEEPSSQRALRWSPSLSCALCWPSSCCCANASIKVRTSSSANPPSIVWGLVSPLYPRVCGTIGTIVRLRWWQNAFQMRSPSTLPLITPRRQTTNTRSKFVSNPISKPSWLAKI